MNVPPHILKTWRPVVSRQETETPTHQTNLEYQTPTSKDSATTRPRSDSPTSFSDPPTPTTSNTPTNDSLIYVPELSSPVTTQPITIYYSLHHEKKSIVLTNIQKSDTIYKIKSEVAHFLDVKPSQFVLTTAGGVEYRDIRFFSPEKPAKESYYVLFLSGDASSREFNAQMVRRAVPYTVSPEVDRVVFPDTNIFINYSDRELASAFGPETLMVATKEVRDELPILDSSQIVKVEVARELKYSRTEHHFATYYEKVLLGKTHPYYHFVYPNLDEIRKQTQIKSIVRNDRSDFIYFLESVVIADHMMRQNSIKKCYLITGDGILCDTLVRNKWVMQTIINQESVAVELEENFFICLMKEGSVHKWEDKSNTWVSFWEFGLAAKELKSRVIMRRDKDLEARSQKKISQERDEELLRSREEAEKWRSEAEELLRSREEAEKWRSEAEELREEMKRSQEESEKWRSEAEELREEMKRSREESGKWRREFAELREELKKLREK